MISNSYLLISRLSDHVISRNFTDFWLLKALILGGFFPLADAVWLASKLDLCSQEGKSMSIYAMGYHGSNCATKHTQRQCGGPEYRSKPSRWTRMVRTHSCPRAAGDL